MFLAYDYYQKNKEEKKKRAQQAADANNSGYGHLEETEMSSSLQKPDTQDNEGTQKKSNTVTEAERKKFIYKRMLSFILVLVVDIGLPLALYYSIRTVLADVYALLISGIPPFLFVVVKFIYKRRIDALGCLVVIAYIVSAVISIVTGDARATLLRDSGITATIALLFGLSLLPIRTPWFHVRPLTFLVGQQMYQEAPPFTWTDANGVHHEMDVMDWLWDVIGRPVRVFHRLLSGGWSFFLFAEFAIRVSMIEATDLPVDRIYLYGTIITVVVVVFMTTCTIIGAIKLQRIAKKWAQENDYTDRFSGRAQTQDLSSIA